MKNKIVTPEPVVLEGYQAILRPSKYGYSLATTVGQEMVDILEEDRAEALKWAESKLKNPKRSTLKPEPWEEVEEGKYKIKFSWNEDNKPAIVDTDCIPITDDRQPLYSGSTVRLCFYQKPYLLKDGVTYGTSLKLQAIQIKSLSGQAGVDTGDMSVEDAAALFGNTTGFKQAAPNVTVTTDDDASDDDEF